MPFELREGCPDPLIYYLHAAALAHHQAICAAGASNDNPLTEQLLAISQSTLIETSFLDLGEASCARLSAMISGIDKWRAHPYHRDLPDPPVIWSKGSARLLDYGNGSRGRPVLVIPSLINKPYILDLMEDASFLRYLSGQGIRPAMIDWGDGNGLSAPQTIDDHISDVLCPAFDHLANSAETTPALLGYCMGGTLAVGLAARPGREVKKLAVIGAPWDFSNLTGVSSALVNQTIQKGIGKTRADLRAMGHHFGAVPAQIFQQLFALLSPMQVVQKFSAFDKIDLASARARKFVAVEDWLADSISVKTPAAETILMDWYTENQTARGIWHVLGGPVDPRKISCPTLVVTGSRDHIVPPEISAPLAALIPDCEHYRVEMGHVGMIVGSRAHALVADRLSHFFDAR